MSNGEQQYGWVDGSKGLGIFLVVLGHALIPHAPAKFIFSFHMPLFFFLSGYLFSGDRHPAFLGFVRHRAKSLLLPYLFFYLTLYVYWIFIGNRFGGSAGLSLDRPLRGFFYSSASTLVDLFHPFWFLTCLFIVQLMFYPIGKWVGKKAWVVVGVLTVSSIAGYLSSLILPFRLPWSADTALTSLVFYGAGFLARAQKNFLFCETKSLFLKVSLAGVLLLLSAGVGHGNSSVNLYENRYGNFFYFYLAAFSGVAAFCLMGQLVEKFKVWDWVGKNSMFFYGLHIIGLGLAKAIAWKVLGVAVVATYGSLYWGLFYSVGAMILLGGGIFLARRASQLIRVA